MTDMNNMTEKRACDLLRAMGWEIRDTRKVVVLPEIQPSDDAFLLVDFLVQRGWGVH